MSDIENNEGKKPLLDIRSISKSFGITRALDQVRFTLLSGEVIAILGENGAGKSTLMNILSGVWASGTYEGEFWVENPKTSRLERAEFRSTRDADSSGIAMIHQELAVFSELTVAEHLELNQLPAWINWKQLFRRTQKFLDTLGFGLRAETRVGDLSVGGRQLVEIARALYRDAKILIFDEPTSALTDQEVVKLYAIIEKLRAEGRAIIYITHRLDEVFRLADRMVVLRDGQNAGEASAYQDGVRIAREQIEPQLIKWMVGRSIQDTYPPRNVEIGEELFRVENLCLKLATGRVLVQNLSFTLRRGEILGLGGLLGSGRSESFASLFGVLSGAGPISDMYKISGQVWVKGQRVDIQSPKDAIQTKMAYVSEDRKGSGLVIGQSIRDNMTLPALVAGNAGLTKSKSLFSRVQRDGERRATEKWAKELRIKSASLDQIVGELSGGNQQKVVLAKWLMTDPNILFLDEPTRGIDIGAKVEIYQWIQRLSSQGMGILFASSEMPELLGICHRIIVLREGKYSAEFMAETATQESIMKAASL
jgi:ABC-type sugar transport system ATPase subunit